MSLVSEVIEMRRTLAHVEAAIEEVRVRVGERLDAIEYKLTQQHTDVVLRALVKALSRDMHVASRRPCATCRILSEALGKQMKMVWQSKVPHTPGEMADRMARVERSDEYQVGIKRSTLTCHDCRDAYRCIFAFNTYNQHGDCLADK